jgi:hypothetical protein
VANAHAECNILRTYPTALSTYSACVPKKSKFDHLHTRNWYLQLTNYYHYYFTRVFSFGYMGFRDSRLMGWTKILRSRSRILITQQGSFVDCSQHTVITRNATLTPCFPHNQITHDWKIENLWYGGARHKPSNWTPRGTPQRQQRPSEKEYQAVRSSNITINTHLDFTSCLAGLDVHCGKLRSHGIIGI